MQKLTRKPELWLPMVLLGIALLVATYATTSIISSKQTINPAVTPTPFALSTSTPIPTETKSIPSTTTPHQTERTYDWGPYKSCSVYSRRNMNTYGTNVNMLDDVSQIRCMENGTEKIMVTVSDKPGHSVANSIYRFWKDSDGYKLLLVDQNGAGSGEGHGKIVQLFNDSSVLLSCFYFVSNDFITVNTPIEWGTPLSVSELSAVKKNIVDRDSSDCKNFTLTSSVR